MPWRNIPPKWWAVMIGVVFGSIALIAMDGPRKGYGKTVLGAILTAPLLALIAGGLLPRDTSLEIAAVVGGVVAVGGMGVVLAVARFAPAMVSAGLSGMATSYLKISAGETTRIHPDGTPTSPDPEADKLVRQFDEGDDK